MRKRIEELIAEDRFLSATDREIMENRTLESVIADPKEPELDSELPESETDDWSDIDPQVIRAALAEAGIENGRVVDPDREIISIKDE